MSRGIAVAPFALFVAFVVAFPHESRAAEGKRSADEKALMKLETEWSAAIQAADLATLERILADDFVQVGAFGSADKKKVIADLRSGAYKVTSMSPPRDMKIRFFGDVAVVTGAGEEKSSFQGKDTSGTWVWTDVWVKRKGKWQAVASQATPVSPK
jgi:ketosteroid isomerase-like protein